MLYPIAVDHELIFPRPNDVPPAEVEAAAANRRWVASPEIGYDPDRPTTVRKEFL
jgi:hypothetical protein